MADHIERGAETVATNVRKRLQQAYPDGFADLPAQEIALVVKEEVARYFADGWSRMSDREIVAQLLGNRSRLTAWERGFAEDMERNLLHYPSLHAGQRTKLLQVARQRLASP